MNAVSARGNGRIRVSLCLSEVLCRECTGSSTGYESEDDMDDRVSTVLEL